MTSLNLGWLAPEIPSSSATFVYREALAVAAHGARVIPFSLRRASGLAVSEDGKPFLESTEIVYGDWRARIAGASQTVLRHPIRSLRVARRAARDMVRGRFARPAQRWKVPIQVIAALALARRLEARGVEHLHVHFAHAVATVGMYAAEAAGLPFSVTAHANDLFVEGSLLAEKIDRAHAFLTISEANRRWLRDRIGATAEKVGLLRCGTDLEVFRPQEAARRMEEPCVAAVGRCVPKKGFDVLIRAFAEFHRRRPAARLHILGDGPERAGLERLADELGLTPAVSFHGAVDRARILEVFARSTLFVLPSRPDAAGDRDGIPVALMEAMASGLPVISTTVSGIPELIEGEVSGSLVPPANVEALADAMLRLAACPEYAARLAAAGREAVRREFDVRKNSRALLDLCAAPPAAPHPASRHNANPTPEKRIMSPAPLDMRPTGATCRRVVVISPVRNEEQLLPGTIDAMVRQTLTPARWIIVDDGSTDGTAGIAERAARAHPWIRLVRRQDRGHRRLGGGVVRAFYEGLEANDADYDLLGKLDADMTFAPDYLETLVARFESDPKLGAASGKVFRPEGEGFVEEFMIDDMVAGQFKLWRRACFQDIGGIVPEVMWDGIDFHRARQHGWTTRSFADPVLRLIHHRLMGSSDRSIWRGRLRWGRGQYFMGSHPLYILASSLWRCRERPRVMGGALIALGYAMAMVSAAPRYDDASFRRELRNWQLRRLGGLVRGGTVR